MRSSLLALALLFAAACSSPEQVTGDRADEGRDGQPSSDTRDEPDRGGEDRRTPPQDVAPDAVLPVDVPPGEKRTSITQYGITWTFDKAYETGIFVTGDPWVVGPVTIVSISPEPTGTRNGSAVDPTGGHQGYDDRGGEYDTRENIALPFVLEPDRSLVSSVSKPEGVETQNVGCLVSQAVLTSVSAPVAPTVFRPSYAGTYKRYLDSAQIRWELLPGLPVPADDAPDVAELAGFLDRPRIDHLSSWTIQFSCAQENWNNGEGAHACYGREYGTVISEAAVAVLLDTPERDALTLALIQVGIDNYGVLQAGGNWAANGGHHNGRKWPIVFAARMLDDCELLAVGQDFAGNTFGEDGQTYASASGTALFGWDCGGGQGSYFEDGCMGGGAKDCRDPAGMVDGCPDYRDCCTSAYWVGEALAARLLGAEGVWNHDPFFDYVDRWMDGQVSGQVGGSSAFVDGMWATYRDAPPAAPAPPRSCN